MSEHIVERKRACGEIEKHYPRERIAIFRKRQLSRGLALPHLIAHLEFARHGVEVGHRVDEHARRLASARLVEVVHRGEAGEGDGRED